MKNRILPYGYRMEMGELLLNIEEAEVVRWIFEQYCAGIPYSILVDKLEVQPIPYDENKPWNKNMVARILEDQRYIGEKGFPSIVSRESFYAAQEIRNSKRVPIKKSDAQKILRQLSGRRINKKMEARTIDILNALVANPAQIQSRSSADSDAHDLTAELDNALSELPIDEERAKMLVFQTAAAKYRVIGSEEYETQRLRHIAEQADTMVSLDATLLRSMVMSIETDQSGCICVRLKNGQVITGVNEYENSPSQSHHYSGKA